MDTMMSFRTEILAFIDKLKYCEPSEEHDDRTLSGKPNFLDAATCKAMCLTLLKIAKVKRGQVAPPQWEDDPEKSIKEQMELDYSEHEKEKQKEAQESKNEESQSSGIELVTQNEQQHKTVDMLRAI